MVNQSVYSVLGVGFGPANLSLAVALEEFAYSGRIRFVEKARCFQRQSELLLSGTDIQNNPLRDLAMPRNPHSSFTFINYLTAQGKLVAYLHRASKFPLRREYAGYLGWAADAFSRSVDYARSVTQLALVEGNEGEVWSVETEDGRRLFGETLVIGTGRSPRIPAQLQRHLSSTVFHSTQYLSSIERLQDNDIHVVVVGASQSAIEILLDLLERPNIRRVSSVQRGLGFRLKDTSPCSRRVFLPDFVDYFYPLPYETKKRIRAELRSVNYAACDQDVIERLATLQYEYELTGSDRLQLMPYSEVAEVATHRGVHRLSVRDVNYGTVSAIDADVVILATGFRDFGVGVDDEWAHPLFEGMLDRLAVERWRFKLARPIGMCAASRIREVIA
ncbi:MAG: SidA/IucD/PvdA family monooxygenase [Actinomycetota bacterium]|nr:SidA/IucD/PvdA family monooxygenase [Actinomycetota bacterium]